MSGHHWDKTLDVSCNSKLSLSKEHRAAWVLGQSKLEKRVWLSSLATNDYFRSFWEGGPWIVGTFGSEESLSNPALSSHRWEIGSPEKGHKLPKAI